MLIIIAVTSIISLFMCFSEKADPSYCKHRITEGANINKSLVTLGIVISTLGKNNINFYLNHNEMLMDHLLNFSYAAYLQAGRSK